MIFSSIIFLCVFMPAVFIAYYLCPAKSRNLLLLLASLVFYAWGEPGYILVMVSSIIINYLAGRLVSTYKEKLMPVKAKAVFIISIILNICILFFFKYTGFFIQIINNTGFTKIPLIDIALPICISFYTFQTMSYIADVYTGTTKAQKNLVNFAMYVSMFPQLIAGPVVRYGQVEEEIHLRKLSIEDTALGIQKFITGLGKKVIFANQAGALWKEISDVPASENSILLAWLGAIAYTFQIYFDFSGYSDMAASMGQMLGFTFPANFNYPYQSKSITEFWRRWHISLSTWFKEYVYIPLGGSRKGFARQALNLFIVWALTGLWHGAAWNFVIWGIYFFILLLIEKCFLLKFLEKIPKVLSHIYALFFIITGWVIFACGDITRPVTYIKSLAGINVPFFNNYTIYKLYTNILLLLIMAAASTKLPVYIFNWLTARLNETTCFWIKAAFTFIILITSMALLISESYNPFLYFRF